MERASGVEPPSEAWEAAVLPINYARILIFTTLAVYHKVITFARKKIILVKMKNKVYYSKQMKKWE